MSNYDERGAYSPRNDEPLAFDARYPRGGERRPVPTTLILSAIVLILLAAGVFFYYRSGIRSDGEAPRVLGEPVGEMTSPPPASAQPVDPTAGLEVYNTERAPTAEPAPPTFAPEPEQPVARPAPAPARPAPAAAIPAPTPAAARPAAAPAAKPPALRPAAPASAAPAATPPAAATPAPAKPAAAPKPVPAAAGGRAVVQIGAFSSAAQADKGWNDVARALPGDMAGRGKRVEQADVGGNTFHRTYVTGFGSKTDAQAFCAKLKDAGKSCIVR